jgi:DNA-binding transcriptional regulator YiaG
LGNLTAVLRQEISRIARKETRAQIAQLRKASAGYRRTIAALKRQIADQGRAVATLRKTSTRAATPAKPEAGASSPRFRADGVAAHRKRLGLSAESFAKLVGVSGQTVYNWEKGKRPRAAQLAALSAVRTMGKREAMAKLESLSTRAAPNKRRAAKKRVAKRVAKKR